MSPELSIVIPLYREAQHLAASVAEIVRHAAPLTPDWELVLVDDGSPDTTWSAIVALAHGEPRIRGLRLSRNFGKERAVAAGLDVASGRAIVVMDGDLQHPPELIPVFYDIWKRGQARVVEGVKRRRRDDSLLRAAGGRIFGPFARWATGIDLTNSSDFKLLDRSVLEQWGRMAEVRPFFRGMIDWVGFDRAQVEFDVGPRRAGSSRWGVARLFGLAWNVITSFSAAPLRLIFAFASAFLIFAVALSARALYLYFTGVAFTGFTTVIILLLMVGGLILISLGIIAEYIAAIYDEMKKRPRYIVAERSWDTSHESGKAASANTGS